MRSKFKFNSLIVAMGMAVVSIPGIAAAQDDGLEEIVVVSVGSRAAPRSVGDSPVPVDVIGSDEILANGSSNIDDILRTVSPSYNVNSQAISDGATVVRPANLRGLSPDSTLILVNGKRRHRGSVIAFSGGGIADGAQGPDVSTIPAIALKQIEVLRDGASAQYGSDAIAGVINFELNDSDSGGKVQVKVGEYSEGDGALLNIAANVGMGLTENGFLNLSFEFNEQDATSRSTQRGDAQGLIDAGNSAVRTPAAQVWGSPEISDDIKFFFNSAIELDNGSEVYAFGNHSEKTVEGGFFFRNPNTRGGIFSGPTLEDGTATILVGDLTPGATDNSACPIVRVIGNVPDAAALASLEAANCYAHNLRFPGGFTPFFGGDVNENALAVGIRGEFNDGTSYDFSGSYGEHTTGYFISNTVNSSLGPNTPTSFNPGGYEQLELSLNADFSKEIGDMVVSYGFEYRDETFTINAGELASFTLGPLVDQGFSIGSNGFPGFKDSDAGEFSRNSSAVYVDVESQLSDRFLGEVAVRYEDFSDFGDTFDWKLTGLFDVNDSLKLRGSISTGFRAPTVGQASVRAVQTQFDDGVLIDIATLPPTNAVSARFGGVQLTPEESNSVTFGFVYEAENGLFITADFFNIEVTDRISQTSAIPLSDADRAELLSLGVTDAIGLNSVTFFTNDFDTTTKGFDLVANYSNDAFGGEMKYTLAFNHTETSVDAFGPNINVVKIFRLEQALPEDKGSFTATYFAEKWSMMNRINYYGSFSQSINGSNLNNVINGPAELLFDTELQYAWNDKVGFSLGINNITDENGPIDPSHSSGRTYSSTTPYGSNGRFYYAKVTYDF